MKKQSIKKRLSKFDVISFDIYETLIYRIFAKPCDLFKYIDDYLNDTPINFEETRLLAEKMCVEKLGLGKYDYDDIYSAFAMVVNDSQLAEKFKHIEENLEFQCVIKNNEIFELYQYAIQLKKKIIITSDMYFSSYFLTKILNKCGITTYDHLFVSCEEKASKHSGEMFRIVKNKFKKQSILHIGDSYRGDYLMPKLYNVHSIHYEKIKLKNEQIESSLIDKLIQIKSRTKENYYLQIGYKCLGPLIFGFCNWLYNAIKNDNKPIFFLSREGYFIKEIFELIYPEYKNRNHYLYVSRKSTNCLKLKTIVSFNDLIKMVPINKQISEYKYFSNIGIDYGKSDINITNNTIQSLPVKKINEISEKNTELSNTLIDYLNQSDFNGNVYICDIGWKGSMQDSLSDIPGVNINGLYLAIQENINKNKTGYANYAMFRPFVHFIENCFMANHGTTLGYKNNNGEIEPILGKVEFKDDKFTNIQNGATSFVQDIIKTLNGKINITKTVALNNMLSLGLKPKISEIKLFQNENYLEGEEINLVNFNFSSLYYLFHIRKLIHDFRNSGWKVAFLKKFFKLPLPYYKAYLKFIKRKEA